MPPGPEDLESYPFQVRTVTSPSRYAPVPDSRRSSWIVSVFCRADSAPQRLPRKSGAGAHAVGASNCLRHAEPIEGCAIIPRRDRSRRWLHSRVIRRPKRVVAAACLPATIARGAAIQDGQAVVGSWWLVLATFLFIIVWC
jgi:hypothetical protein